MKRIISAVIAGAAAFSAVLSYYGSANAVEEGSGNMVKIMCIGDSITDGYVQECAGSYRKFIYHGLTEMGYSIDMVGAKSAEYYTPEYTDTETGVTFTYDDDHSGYPAYTIEAYDGRSGVFEALKETDCLKKTSPDIVTLQIGTNDIIDNHDIDGAYSRLNNLAMYILENIPENSVLFISTVPDIDPNRPKVYNWFGNYRHSPTWDEMYDDDTAEAAVKRNIAEYNATVRKLANALKENGLNVEFSDAADAITDVKAQLLDGVHPNNSGYKAIGEAWTRIIGGYLSGKTEEPQTPDKPDNTEKFTVADLVKLSKWLNGAETMSAEDAARFDLDSDGRVDVFDLVLLRQNIVKKQ